jgi:hypothetical protein
MINGETGEELGLKKVTLRLNAVLAGVISVVSFSTGAASIYYGVNSDLNSIRTEIRGLNESGSRAFRDSRPDFETMRKDLTEVKNDVKWIIRQIDRNGSVKATREQPASKIDEQLVVKTGD